jgi:HSP20 family protein
MRVTDLIPWVGSEGRTVATRGRGDPFGALQFDINRVFDDFLRGFDLPLSRINDADADEVAGMRMDIDDRDKEVVVSAELPGLEDGDLDVFVSDGVLTIRGEKQVDRESKEGGQVLRERRYGVVERSVPLPDGVDPDKATASLKRGVLTIRIPKTAKAGSNVKRVSVQTS